MNLSPFPHSLSIFKFSLHFLAARLSQFVQPCYRANYHYFGIDHHDFSDDDGDDDDDYDDGDGDGDGDGDDD